MADKNLLKLHKALTKFIDKRNRQLYKIIVRFLNKEKCTYYRTEHSLGNIPMWSWSAHCKKSVELPVNYDSVWTPSQIERYVFEALSTIVENHPVEEPNTKNLDRFVNEVLRVLDPKKKEGR